MRYYCLQMWVTLVPALLSLSTAHLLDGFQNWRYNFPQAPHPMMIPPTLHHLPPPRDALPFAPLHPPQLPHQIIIVPVQFRGSFPPFIERIVQRIQTWWSVYNPPEFLTRPPLDLPTTKSPRKKTTTSTTTTPVPKQEAETEAATEAVEEPETTTSAPSAADPSVSTLAVFEVTPEPSDLAADTEEPLFITPEKASLLGGQRDAFLRFLQTGKVPPYLESDTVNEMDERVN